MGCGASAKKTVWACAYCGDNRYTTFETCTAHEGVCAANPAAAKGAPAAAPGAPAAAPQAKAKAAPGPQGGAAKGPAYPQQAGGGGNLRDFLQGLGVRDIDKALQGLKSAGIETRGDFFTLDKDMRQELDGELKTAGVNLGDRAKIKKAENVGVPVKQGNGEVTVLALQPGQAMQTADSLVRVFLGMGWTEKKPGGKPIDVDASCVGFNTGNPSETVFFGNLKNQTKSVVHTGDVLQGGKGKDITDLERIYVWLPNVPANINCLVFTAQVYTEKKDFSDISNAYVRMANADTNQELARLTLGGGGMKGNGLVFAKVYRCGPKGPWHFHCLGMPLNVPGASNVEAMVPHLKKSGCAFSPPAAMVKPGQPTPAPVSKSGKPVKSQTPTGVYVAGALAVATVAGVAAATAIYLSDTPMNADMFNPGLFEGGVDFGNLVPTGDTLTGIGDGIADGAGAAYDWAGDVTDSIDFGGIGDTMGDAVGTVGDGLGDAGGWAAGAAGDVMGSDAMGAVGDGLGDAGGWAAGAAGDAGGWVAGDGMDAMGDAGGAVAGFAGDAGGAMASGAGDAAGAIGDAAPGILEGLGSAVGAMGGMFGGLVDMFGGDD